MECVQQRVSLILPHAIYVRCAHRLNLCLVHTIKNIPLLPNFFKTVHSLYKFLMNSQTRYEVFIGAQKKMTEKKKNMLLLGPGNSCTKDCRNMHANMRLKSRKYALNMHFFLKKPSNYFHFW